MEAKKIVTAEILSNRPIAKGIMELKLLAPESASQAKPGQFVNVYTGDSSLLLPRPISICDADDTTLTLIYAVVGKGTAWFADCCVGQELRVSTPLGNGFDVSVVREGDTALLIGGGIGSCPLLKLGKVLKEKGVKLNVAIGFRDEPFLEEEFRALGANVVVATDSGRVGYHGTALAAAMDAGMDCEHWFTCGPKIMLKFVAKEAMARGRDAQVSMEERMGCGYGACVGCVVDVLERGAEAPVRKKVCKDGPVFLGSEVFFDEQ
ncbi:MAG: dihydroorotate dehydrogenase electron transfer subunit [Firmicutes bacterium]|nr:dihydroorotate dehydrogenase electron transfer subunit [Bacillota bacterium]